MVGAIPYSEAVALTSASVDMRSSCEPSTNSRAAATGLPPCSRSVRSSSARGDSTERCANASARIFGSMVSLKYIGRNAA